jgi:putative CocE/NonD family hydrolase
VLAQSCRGTFGSGGQFDPFAERDDGLATVAWLRKQPWYPGAFATAGPSYLGIVQWAIAGEAGADLKAMAALVTSTDPYSLIFDGNGFSLETTLVWINLVAKQEQRLSFLRQGGYGRALKPIFTRLPLDGLDREATGHEIPEYQAWLAHPSADDPYWDNRRFTAARSAVTAQVSLAGGWQDIFLPSQLRDYAALREAGHEPYLLIGPWQHTDSDGIAMQIRDSIAWLRAQLLDDRSQLRPSPVRIYVGGLEQWRDLPSWPPPAVVQRWHLQADGALAEAQPAASEPDTYTYDPADPTPSVGGPVLTSNTKRRTAPLDNSELEARADVLTYTSAPMESDFEVIGQVSADLYVKSSLEHTDFFARLCDVDSGGRSLNICDALVRLEPGTLTAEPDGTTRVVIDLWPTAYRFKAGHRIRLQVSSGAHPRYARNPGSGEPLATATKLVPAEQQVFHDPEHPSALVLPVTTAAS